MTKLIHQRLTSPRGFTLIELLVVISIISLLIAFLLPALGSARDAAVFTQNLSQMRQLSLSFSTYAQDYKGFYPASKRSASPNNIYFTSLLLNGKYVIDESLFWGPARDTRNKNVQVHPGYAMNDRIAPELSATSTWVTYNIWHADNAPPGEQLVFIEAFRADKYTSEGLDGWFHTAPGQQSGITSSVFTYQGGKTGIAYFDGHVGGESSNVLYWNATDPRTGLWLAESYRTILPWEG